MVKKLKNLNKIKMNDVCNRTKNYLNPVEFCSPLSPENMLGDNRKNHHDFLKLIDAEPPEIPKEVTTAQVKCPTEAQELREPIGTLVDGGTKKIIKYRLVGKECIPIKEDITIVDQFVKGIPSTNQVTTTASIAIVATAAAAATPFLLKAVKPIVKQIIKNAFKEVK